MSGVDLTLDPDELVIDLRFVPELGGQRPAGRTLGALARQYLEDGGPPPVPRPTLGLPGEGVLPLFYPGLNAIAADSGVGKSMLLKYVARQVIQAPEPGRVLVLDCETSAGEYAATMMSDFAMPPSELDRLHYAIDVHRSDETGDRWSGEVSHDLLDAAMDGCAEPPGLVLVDSQSKSMALHGFDENRAIDVTRWFEAITGPLLSHWSPMPAVVLVQGRPKGWHIGQDVRQGRGNTALLHEVVAQYLLWQKQAGSRSVDGRANLVSTKDRYGHRVDGRTAAVWEYGPSGFWLREAPSEAKASDEQVREAVLRYLATEPRDPELTDLPPTETQAVDAVVGALKVKPDQVRRVLATLIEKETVSAEELAQPGKRGPRPTRVWVGSG